jgi:hypothetical protein
MCKSSTVPRFKAVEKALNHFFKHSCAYVAVIFRLDPDSVKPESRFRIQQNTSIRIQCIRIRNTGLLSRMSFCTKSKDAVLRIRCLFDPWSRDGKNPDPEHVVLVFWKKILMFFDADPDPGFCNPGWKKLGSGSWIIIPDPQKCKDGVDVSGRSYVCGILKAISGSLVHLNNHCRHY